MARRSLNGRLAEVHNFSKKSEIFAWPRWPVGNIKTKHATTPNQEIEKLVENWVVQKGGQF